MQNLKNSEALFIEIYSWLDQEIPENTPLRRNEGYLMIKGNPCKNLHREWTTDDYTEYLKSFRSWFDLIGEHNIPVTYSIMEEYVASLSKLK